MTGSNGQTLVIELPLTLHHVAAIKEMLSAAGLKQQEWRRVRFVTPQLDIAGLQLLLAFKQEWPEVECEIEVTAPPATDFTPASLYLQAWQEFSKRQRGVKVNGTDTVS